MTPRPGRRVIAASLGALLALSSGAAADQVIADDLIVQSSLCVGIDCVNNEIFGSVTLQLKQNSTRMLFRDTSTGAFPANSWQILANDAGSGGDNYLAFQDFDTGRQLFRIEAGGPANALYVDNAGRIGLGTNTPVTEMHVVDGETPTLRLEQNTSQGFNAQTWDIAGNEINFFIRDVTNGSTLPLRIRPGAASNAIDIANDSDVYIGLPSTTSDEVVVGDLVVGGSGLKLVDIFSTDGNPTQYRMISDSGNRRFVALNNAGNAETQMIFNNTKIALAGANDGAELWATIDTNGITLPAGSAFSVNGTDLAVPDYVFGADYELMPLSDLAAFIDVNSHLPGVPSAAEVRANGLDLTAMQLALLEKVEELTLYTLVQNRHLEKQDRELAKQDEELAKLREELDSLKN